MRGDKISYTALILSLVCLVEYGTCKLHSIGRREDFDICPSLSMWERRSQDLCDRNPSQYHCLLTQSEQYLEVCTDPIQVPEGQFPLISEARDTLYTENCPDDQYQPKGGLSNQYKKVKCDYPKSLCNGVGELNCDDGSTTSNRRCRCNYMDGFRASVFLLTNENNESCFFKHTSTTECIQTLPCSDGEELNPAYKCVKACEDGSHRPFGEFDCVQYRTSTAAPKASTVPKPVTDLTTTIPTIPPTSSKPTEHPNTEKETVPLESWKTAAVVIIVIGGVIVLILVAYCLIEKYFRIRIDFQNHIQKVHAKEDVKFKGTVNGYCCCRIVFEWTLIKKEDSEHEEQDLEEWIPSRRFDIDSTSSSSALTIKNVSVGDEADYVLTAYLKIWKRISHKQTFTLIVLGDGFYTPLPSPMGSAQTSPNIPPKEPPRAGFDTDLETPRSSPKERKIHADVYIEKVEIRSGENIIFGDGGTILYNKTRAEPDQTEESNGKRKKKKSKKKRKNSSSEDSSSEESKLLPDPKPFPVSTLDRRKKNLEMLVRKAPYNLHVVDVPGDGSCLYHAFLHNKDVKSLPNSPFTLRKQLVKYLESNPKTPDGTEYKDFLCLPVDADRGRIEREDEMIEDIDSDSDKKELRWQRFLKRIQDNDWGGSLEIMGLAQLYNVPVTVLSIGSGGYRLVENEFNHTPSSTQNPIIYLGHISIGGKGTHFVALEPKTVNEKGESSKDKHDKGEELRKTVPSQYPYKDGHIIYGNALHLKIGCIEMNKGHSKEYGTAFRVGSKYVMTAYHVIADTLESFWKEVYRNLKPEDKYNLNISKEDKYPAEGEWSLAKVVRALDPELQGKLLELGKGMITDSCTIKFSLFGNEKPILSEICHDVPFFSRTHDVAILELKDVSAASKNCISLQRTKIPSEQLHVIGHPDGRDLQHDPGCRIINDEKELAKLKCKGIEFFQKLNLNIDVVSDYKSCSIDREKLLFHCSDATAHGASGSPLIVIPKEKPIVTGMLIHGHPKFFYNYLRNNPEAQEHPEYLIESGISMEKVAELLEEHNLSSLLNDIFSA